MQLLAVQLPTQHTAAAVSSGACRVLNQGASTQPEDWLAASLANYKAHNTSCMHATASCLAASDQAPTAANATHIQGCTSAVRMQGAQSRSNHLTE
jgi:hypothetical protein